MKHFTTADWADFVRGVADDGLRVAMQTHLSSGCSRCERTVQLFRNVATASRAEAAYEPPDRVIRYARALYSLHRPEKVGLIRLIGRLVHDSALMPQPAGMRSDKPSARHLLYEAGGYFLDVQVEQQPDAERISLVGQIAARDSGDVSTAHLPVSLMDRHNVVASTVSNHFGEFQLECAPARTLQLSVPLPEAGKRLEVSLRQPEGLSDGKIRPFTRENRRRR